MGNTSKKHLMELSTDTKQLVNQGVFSLYSLADQVSGAEQASYVLYTGSQSFLLSDDGLVVKELAPTVRFKVTKAVNFPEVAGKPIVYGKTNIA
jgi:hypothetical protein